MPIISNISFTPIKEEYILNDDKEKCEIKQKYILDKDKKPIKVKSSYIVDRKDFELLNDNIIWKNEQRDNESIKAQSGLGEYKASSSGNFNKTLTSNCFLRNYDILKISFSNLIRRNDNTIENISDGCTFSLSLYADNKLLFYLEDSLTKNETTQSIEHAKSNDVAIKITQNYYSPLLIKLFISSPGNSANTAYIKEISITISNDNINEFEIIN